MEITIQQLERESGVSRRTIRFYIHRGLLSGPEGNKRAAYYTDEHLQQLRRIRQLIGEGYGLDQILKILAGVESRVIIEAEVINETEAELESTLREVCRLRPGIEIHYQPGLLKKADLASICQHLNHIFGSES
jgi:DNA-binding transcriptional MerR regulator